MLFGHEEKEKAFKNLADSGALSHAYLFFGDSQIGKCNFAQSLAYYLEYGKFEILESPLIDSVILKRDERGIIGIDEARQIRNFLWQTPLKSARRTVIIDEAEALTPEAQSSMLKIVEEPPKHGLIIFIACDSQVLFPPLLSRLTKIYFARLSKTRIREILIKHFNIPVKKAESAAEESFGRMGWALNLISSKKIKNQVGDLKKNLERTIFDLRSQNLIKNSSVLKWLLEREMFLKKYNLNNNIQKKVIDYKLQKN
ncbi:MAG: hypothetical protein QMD65_00665 [Patescibacteria group bacterium]|nr:hypothetical protein [Patescibacteria group bacterium]